MAGTGNQASGRDTRIEVMRSQLGRVRGLGSAKSGVGHWWAERVTSIALVPLTLWFILAVIGHLGASQQDIIEWMGHPITLALMLCLILATFYHMQLGLQVVIDDYVHVEQVRFASLLVMRGVVALLTLLSVIAALRLGL